MFSDGPVVSFQPSGIIQILVGESLILKCDVRANPPVSLVTWFKDGVLQKGMAYFSLNDAVFLLLLCHE